MVPWAYKHALGYTQNTEKLLKGFLARSAIKRFGEPAQKLWDKTLAVAKESKDAR